MTKTCILKIHDFITNFSFKIKLSLYFPMPQIYDNHRLNQINFVGIRKSTIDAL